MKTLVSLIALTLLVHMAPSALAQDTYTLFKAAASLTVTKVIPGDIDTNFNDSAVAKTLGTSDVINLALGRPLGTKVTTMLAVAVVAEGPGMIGTPKTRLVVYDPAAMGVTRIAATVATLTALDTEATAPVNGARKGQGISGVQIVETVGGQDNKFFSTTLRGAAMGKATANAATPGGLSAFSVAATGLAGPLHVKFTTMRGLADEFDGFVIKSKFTAGGKPLDSLTF